jgi:hypothetical protein
MFLTQWQGSRESGNGSPRTTISLNQPHCGVEPQGGFNLSQTVRTSDEVGFQSAPALG